MMSDQMYMYHQLLQVDCILQRFYCHHIRPIKRHRIFLHLCLSLLLPSLPVFSSSLHLCKSVDTAKIQESAHMMELANQIHELISYLIGQFHRLSTLLSFNYEKTRREEIKRYTALCKGLYISLSPLSLSSHS